MKALAMALSVLAVTSVWPLKDVAGQPDKPKFDAASIRPCRVEKRLLVPRVAAPGARTQPFLPGG